MTQFQMTTTGQDAEAFAAQKKMASGQYVQRIKLIHGTSAEFIDGKAEVKDFMLGKTNLGKSFLAIVGEWRPHALQFEDGKVQRESFDLKDPVYLEIAEGAAAYKQGWGAGPDFLMWLPEYRAFGTLHFTRGALDNGDEGFKRANQLVRVTHEMTGKKRRYHIPVILDAPQDVDPESIAVPSKEAHAKALKQFRAPTLERKAEEGDGPPR